jgi:hypothetical protein
MTSSRWRLPWLAEHVRTQLASPEAGRRGAERADHRDGAGAYWP